MFKNLCVGIGLCIAGNLFGAADSVQCFKESITVGVLSDEKGFHFNDGAKKIEGVPYITPEHLHKVCKAISHFKGTKKSCIRISLHKETFTEPLSEQSESDLMVFLTQRLCLQHSHDEKLATHLKILQAEQKKVKEAAYKQWKAEQAVKKKEEAKEVVAAGKK